MGDRRERKLWRHSPGRCRYPVRVDARQGLESHPASYSSVLRLRCGRFFGSSRTRRNLWPHSTRSDCLWRRSCEPVQIDTPEQDTSAIRGYSRQWTCAQGQRTCDMLSVYWQKINTIEYPETHLANIFFGTAISTSVLLIFSSHCGHWMCGVNTVVSICDSIHCFKQRLQVLMRWSQVSVGLYSGNCPVVRSSKHV